jgi:hypothetical protein
MTSLAGLQLPAAARRNHVEMRVVLPIAAMRLDDDDVAALEGATLNEAEDIIQTAEATAYERTQHC